MELLNSKEYEIARPFFQNIRINEPLLHSILENKSAGKIFTDNKSNPTFMLVCSLAGYTFLEGNPDQFSLKKIADYLKTLPKVSLISSIDWKFRTYFEKTGFKPVERQQFRNFSSVPLENWQKQVSPHYVVERIDAERFPHCQWHSFIQSFFGDFEHFSSHGVGFCLTDQGKIVSESYGIFGAEKAEIGTVTNEEYRGKNLGTFISAWMLDYCSKRVQEVIWSCDVSNPASMGIARKLNFEENCQYLFLKWPTS